MIKKCHLNIQLPCMRLGRRQRLQRFPKHPQKSRQGRDAQ